MQASKISHVASPLVSRGPVETAEKSRENLSGLPRGEMTDHGWHHGISMVYRHI